MSANHSIPYSLSPDTNTKEIIDDETLDIDFSDRSAEVSPSKDLSVDIFENRSLFFTPKSGRLINIADDAVSISSRRADASNVTQDEDEDTDPELSFSSLDDLGVGDLPSTSKNVDFSSVKSEFKRNIVSKKSLDLRELAYELSSDINTRLHGFSDTDLIRSSPVEHVYSLSEALISPSPLKEYHAASKTLDVVAVGPFLIKSTDDVPVIDQLSPELISLLDIRKSDNFSKPNAESYQIYPIDNFIRVEKQSNGKEVFSACSIYVLVDLLVSNKTESDLDFVTDFLMTFSYFADPFDIARLLFLRYLQSKQTELCKASQTSKEVDWEVMTQMRLLNVLRKWIDNHPWNFEETKSLTKLVVLFLKLEVEKDQKRKVFVSSILSKLNEKISWFHKDPELGPMIGALEKEQQSSNANEEHLKESQITMLDADPELLAIEITLHEFSLFKKIHVNEFFHQAWSIKDRALREKIAPNLLNFINSFNRVAYGVASEIVSIQNLNERVEVLKKFIYIANLCAKMKNLNTCFEIMAGLNLGAVSRLRKTWKNLPKKYMEAWEKLSLFVTNEGNYKVYRRSIQEVIGFPPAVPVLPYLGMFLSDITFIEDGNPTFIEDPKAPDVKLINFSKFRMLAHKLKVIATYQQKNFEYASNENYKSWFLNNWLVLNEAELYKRAKICEPSQKKQSINIGSIREMLPNIGTLSRRSSNLAPSNPDAIIKANRSRSNSSSSRPSLSASFLMNDSDADGKGRRKMFKP